MASEGKNSWPPERVKAFHALNLVLLVLCIVLTAHWGHQSANRQYHKSRAYWGQATVGLVTEVYGNADIYRVWDYDFTYFGRDGQQHYWTTLMPPDAKKKNDVLTLWVARDGNVFVKGSVNVDHNDNVRRAPWPSVGTVVGHYVWIGLIVLLLTGLAEALLIGVALLVQAQVGRPKPPRPPNGKVTVDEPKPQPPLAPDVAEIQEVSPAEAAA